MIQWRRLKFYCLRGVELATAQATGIKGESKEKSISCLVNLGFGQRCCEALSYSNLLKRPLRSCMAGNINGEGCPLIKIMLNSSVGTHMHRAVWVLPEGWVNISIGMNRRAAHPCILPFLAAL